jgi:two-component system, LytTR family, response regulator
MTAAAIRTLIVDDEQAAREALRLLLGDDREIAVVGECADGRTTLERIRRDRPELVFLDIQMPAMDGLTVLSRLEETELPVVVFVTAYDQHALQAFDLHAVDYLLKPFDDARFHKALARAKTRVRQGQLGALAGPLADLLSGMRRPEPDRWLERLVIRSDGRAIIVPVAEVNWIEARGDYLRVHAGSTCHLLRGTMKELEGQLDPAAFVRIHRSTIVRLQQIKELQPHFRGDYVVILKDGTLLKLARGCRDQLEAALGRMP